MKSSYCHSSPSPRPNSHKFLTITPNLPNLLLAQFCSLSDLSTFGGFPNIGGHGLPFMLGGDRHFRCKFQAMPLRLPGSLSWWRRIKSRHWPWWFLFSSSRNLIHSLLLLQHYWYSTTYYYTISFVSQFLAASQHYTTLFWTGVSCPIWLWPDSWYCCHLTAHNGLYFSLVTRSTLQSTFSFQNFLDLPFLLASHQGKS